MSRKYLITLYFLGLVCLVLAFATGFLVNDLVGARSGDFPLFLQAYEIIKNHGFSELPEPPSIEYGMIRGMIEAYGDPHTSFLEPVQHELETNDLQGSFGGIGVRLVTEESGILLLYPFRDGPAALAGVLDADQLISVEGLTIGPDTPIGDITAAIRGPVGEPVDITVHRQPGPEEMSFSIERESVPLPSVTWHLSSIDSRVGVLEVNLLAASTKDEILEAVEDLKSRGATHFVLDLRDNNGGLLDAGIDAARLFLESGLVIEQQFRGEEVDQHRVERPGPLSDLPLVLLINQNTASAAEILAGALQNQGRAELIGQPSFGKDSIQLVFDLTDGSSVHVTSARWWLPGSERLVSEGGLQPDLVVPPSEEGLDSAMQEAVSRLLSAQIP
ncbi:MAG TPA: S41 family peptidase [Anaerolineales bacterium]|nr:S41 family peptidase [Anaerolineales bacterium]